MLRISCSCARLSGWQASIDGKQSEIYRANFAFRAVKIEPGQHTVLFSYQPLTVSIGFPLAGLTFISVLVFIICCLVGIPNPLARIFLN